MKAQKPAEGILLHKDWGDAKSYLVDCECTDPDHAHSVWVERDKDIDAVTVTIYTKATSPLWGISRWKKMWTLLTKGYVEYEAAIYLSEQQAINYATALTDAVKDVQ
jgi:hypothetical protein